MAVPGLDPGIDPAIHHFLSTLRSFGSSNTPTMTADSVPTGGGRAAGEDVDGWVNPRIKFGDGHEGGESAATIRAIISAVSASACGPGEAQVRAPYLRPSVASCGVRRHSERRAILR